MKIQLLIIQDGMSRGDEVYGGGFTFDIILIIFGIIFLLAVLLFKIIDWFGRKDSLPNYKSIEDSYDKPKSRFDKYKTLDKDELINRIYEYMVTKPDRDKFGYSPGSNERYLRALDSLEKSIKDKDKIISNLTAQEISSLQKILDHFDQLSINPPKIF